MNEFFISKTELLLKDFSLKGNYYYYGNNYDEVIKWYDKALAINPNDTFALSNKGQAQLR